MLAAAVIMCLGAAGCSGPCDDPFVSPCPAPFEVTQWCADTSKCSIDGAVTKCLGSCDVAPGERLLIPMVDFADHLAMTHDLRVTYSSTGPTEALPESASVSIGGVAGTFDAALNPEPNEAIFRWAPFPGGAQDLEFMYSDGTAPRVGVVLRFEDGDCEHKNKKPDCPPGG